MGILSSILSSSFVVFDFDLLLRAVGWAPSGATEPTRERAHRGRRDGRVAVELCKERRQKGKAKKESATSLLVVFPNA